MIKSRFFAIASLFWLAVLLQPTPAQTVWWTGATKGTDPLWDGNLLQANWSTFFTVPTASNTVVFGPNFTPSANAAMAGVKANGSEILLTNFDAPGGLPPTAANLVFLNSWTLTQRPGSILFFLNFPFSNLVLAQGDVTVTTGATATLNADVTVTSGQLTKLGPGTLLLEQTVTGSVVVAQGVLGGNFTTTGNLINGATLSPGNSPGTITVQGNFVQNRSGTLDIEIASPSSFDTLLVDGRAKLGGRLDVSLLNGFVPKAGEKFTFLTAGKVSGEFNSADAPVWDDLTLRPFYGKQSVTLKTVVDSFAALPGLTPNERSVGRGLDSVINDPRATNLINYLYGRKLGDLPKDLQKLSPDGVTSIITMGVALENEQSLNLQRRTDDIRSGAGGFNAANLAINGTNPFYSGGFDVGGVAGPSGGDGKEVKETKQVAPTENRWGAFLSGTGEWVNVDGTQNARGYDLVNGGFTLGVDYKVTPNFAIGLASGYTGTTANLADHGRVWVNGGKLGIYGTFFQSAPPAVPAPGLSKDTSKDSSKEAPAPVPASKGGGFYADFGAFGGYNGYSTRRDSVEGEARGNTDGGELNALFGAGYDFKVGGFTFGPTASFNYTYVGFNGYQEHNSLAPLDIHGAYDNSLRSAFGLKASYECQCGGVIIRPELRLAWQHEYGETAYGVDASFLGGSGNTFTVDGPRLGRDSALIGAGFAIQINDRILTYLYYDGEVGRRNYESSAVTGGVRVAF
jgi:outer membrane autotransporter protein